MKRIVFAIACCSVVMLNCSLALAGGTGYLDRAGFMAAVSSLGANTVNENFDSFSDDALLPSGGGAAAVIFNYSLAGANIQVRSVSDAMTMDTPSQPNYAGTDDGGVFQDGDNITIASKGPMFYALGLSISTADALQSGDIMLTANGHQVSLDAQAIQATLQDGAREYFLGIVDTSGFTLADLTTIGGGYFVHTLDNVVVATDLSGGVFSDGFESF